MMDVARGIVFVVCELALLGLVLGPFVIATPRGVATRTVTAPAAVALVLIAAAFAATASIAVFRAYYLGSVVNRPRTLTEAASAGDSVVIRFDPKACTIFTLGTFECDRDYHVRYDSSVGDWTVTGYNATQKADLTSYTRMHADLLKSVARRIVDRHELDLIKRWLGYPVDPIRGTLNLWGLAAEFSDDGRLYLSKQEVGRIAVDLSGPGYARR